MHRRTLRIVVWSFAAVGLVYSSVSIGLIAMIVSSIWGLGFAFSLVSTVASTRHLTTNREVPIERSGTWLLWAFLGTWLLAPAIGSTIFLSRVEVFAFAGAIVFFFGIGIIVFGKVTSLFESRRNQVDAIRPTGE